MSIVRENLLKDRNYKPYCGNNNCKTLPRCLEIGLLIFECPICRWRSDFPDEFIEEYKKTHQIYSHNLKVNDKIKLGYGHIWTVKAVSERYVICTKPYRKIKNVWYTILDFELEIRGTHNYVCSPYDMSIQEDIDQCLKDLISGEIEISHRRNVPLEEIEVVKKDEL